MTWLDSFSVVAIMPSSRHFPSGAGGNYTNNIFLAPLGATSSTTLIGRPSNPRNENKTTHIHEREFRNAKAQSDLKSSKTKSPTHVSAKLGWIDVFVAVGSLLCCALASTVIAHNRLSWWLGVTYQLVVIGFLLSVMNFCLEWVAPMFLLSCEARFGPSTLQNYEAILRSQPFADRVGNTWRAILLLMKTLPLGLSVGYKLLTGGTSTNMIDRSNLLYSSEFGLNAAPGLLPSLRDAGIALMFNSSMTFYQATAAKASDISTGSRFVDPALEPPLPAFPKAYGFNMLLLSEHDVAMLDAPAPSWLESVQAALEPGEHWNVSSTVLATVSMYNDTVENYRDLSKSESISFWEYYGDQANYTKLNAGFTTTVLYNGWNIGLMSSEWGPDESWQFVGIFPDPRDFVNFTAYAKMYNTVRMPCNGTWTITQGSIELVDGACDMARSSYFAQLENTQTALKNNQMVLSQFYMPILLEYLAPFATTRNESRWATTAISAVTAAMRWSKMTSLNSPTLPDFTTRVDGRFADTDLRYQADPIIVSARPALRRSWILFLLFAIQPTSTVVMMLVTLMLHKVPIGREFGLLEVLAGIDVRALEALGLRRYGRELAEPVKLNILLTEHRDRPAEVLYQLSFTEQQSLVGHNATGADHSRQILER